MLHGADCSGMPVATDDPGQLPAGLLRRLDCGFLVWCRRARGMQETLHALDVRHRGYQLDQQLNVLFRVQLPSEDGNTVLDVQVVLTLWRRMVVKGLALDAVAERIVIGIRVVGPVHIYPL